MTTKLPKIGWLVITENGDISNDNYYEKAFLVFRSKKSAEHYHTDVGSGSPRFIKIKLQGVAQR